MNIAVAGDVHGHLALLYAVLGRWQQETDRPIALVLQVGDLGAFAADSALDQATRRHAAHDAEELGFADFAGPQPPATRLDPRPPLVFVPGNHEDFEFLSRCEAQAAAGDATYPVAADGRIHALRSGHVWTFEHAGRHVRVGGVSGAANLRRKPGRHERAHLDEAGALRLAALGRGAFDILISHDGPDGLWPSFRGGPAGSAALRLVVEEGAPRLAFFGHYGRAGEWRVGPTRVVNLDDCGYDHRREFHIKTGGLAMIEWTGDADPRVERIAPSWLTGSTRDDWRHWDQRDEAR